MSTECHGLFVFSMDLFVDGKGSWSKLLTVRGRSGFYTDCRRKDVSAWSGDLETCTPPYGSAGVEYKP